MMRVYSPERAIVRTQKRFPMSCVGSRPSSAQEPLPVRSVTCAWVSPLTPCLPLTSASRQFTDFVVACSQSQGSYKSKITARYVTQPLSGLAVIIRNPSSLCVALLKIFVYNCQLLIVQEE